MTSKRVFQGLLSMGLAAALFLTPLSAGAEELPEESTQVAETAATAGQPEETTAVTLPAETTAPTEPPETIPSTQPTVPETTEDTQPPETTAVTQPSESAEPASSTESEAVTLCTISQARAMPAGTANIIIRGTVVYASGTQAILQDSTGGIRLSFAADPGTVPGEVLQVTGRRSGGFVVEDFESLGTASLPAVETTLLDAPENVRVRIQNATLEGKLLVQNGFSLSLVATIPASAGQSELVEAYGVIIDGRFYADAIYPQAAAFALRVASEEPQQEWNLYFGQLHAHTSLSDGLGTVTEAFEYAANVEGLDFFAVTDYSDSLDNAAFGVITGEGTNVSKKWKEGKEAAAAVTNETFVGLFGYEMCWYEDAGKGHINTFHTPGWQAWGQPGFDDLEDYYDALTTVPGSVSQFNHPGHNYGNFEMFDHYSPAYDQVLCLIETGIKEDPRPIDYYTYALDLGWHLAPTNNQNNHKGNWGDESPVRTVVLAKELTEEALYEAMSSYRVYATEDCDLEIYYRLNGEIMGSILGPEEERTVSISLNDPTDEQIGTVKVLADGGAVVQMLSVPEASADLEFEIPAEYHDCSYYYLHITQPDGDTAITAPIWVDSYDDLGISSFSSGVEQPVEGQEIDLLLELYNQEKEPLILNKLEFFQKEQLIHEVTDPGTVHALSSLTYRFPFTWTQPGEVTITAKVTGTVAGYDVQRETSLTLRYQAEETAACTIAEARAGTPGTAFCVKGYITAGNNNPYNTFSDALYLQDDTGGIAITGCDKSDVEVGTPMEVTGVLRKKNGNLFLEQTACVVLKETYYRYVPRTMTHAVAMDYGTHGGELLQIEGTVVSLTNTSDGKGISRLTLKDIRGDLATVLIEEEITSGAYGTNELAAQIKKGRTVRAMGLLHMDEYGETVLRVRNCDEVVYIPPTADPTNPKTGDGIAYVMKVVP